MSTYQIRSKRLSIQRRRGLHPRRSIPEEDLERVSKLIKTIEGTKSKNPAPNHEIEAPQLFSKERER